MADATCRARRNRPETYCSDSPYHFDSRSEDFVPMKFASDSHATALAKRVLPVPGGPNSYAPDGLWVFEREFDTFTQHLLNLFQAADIFPTHVRQDHDLPQRRRLDALEGVVEAIPEDTKVLQHLGRDLRLLQSDVRQVAAQSLDGSFTTQGRYVGADKTIRNAGQFIQVHVVP
jgi:hypothetical protein